MNFEGVSQAVAELQTHLQKEQSNIKVSLRLRNAFLTHMLTAYLHDATLLLAFAGGTMDVEMRAATAQAIEFLTKRIRKIQVATSKQRTAA